jgi:Low molecular weight phosphotyrosine protein phosphatase
VIILVLMPSASVLVVCLGRSSFIKETKARLICIPGNICRSPMGEAVLAHQVKERGLDIKVGKYASKQRLKSYKQNHQGLI